jgi:phage/plasmid-like protein (TIGR03299 family)
LGPVDVFKATAFKLHSLNRDYVSWIVGHNLFGKRIAFVGEAPWHGLGKRVPESVTVEELCRAAGLNWSVQKEPAPGARIINSSKALYDRYLVVRDPVAGERSKVVLGLVTGSYEVLQNAEAFAFFRPFIESGFATFHTAGALGNGERVWVLAKLNGQISIRAGDLIDRFLLLSNVHDGSGAVSVRFTPIRVVCQNTLNLAMEKGASAISIRHTRNLTQNLGNAQARELHLLIDKVFADATKLFIAMAQLKLSAGQFDEYLERWHRVFEILGDGSVTPEGTEETLWGLYNAVVRDEDYRVTRQTSSGSRLNRVWFGSGSDLKLKALAIGREFLEKAA